MKVYVETDLEGVAGVVTFGVQTSPDGKYYESAKKLLTAEVNAAVEGMVEMGVDDILVNDGHGPGAIAFDELHPAAKLLHGRPHAPRVVRDEIVKTYDVCIMIGQHAMAGVTDGSMNHTQGLAIEQYKLNGNLIGEIAQFALYHGAMGLPMIFLSGDEAGCREAESLMPGIVTTSVKHGLSRSSAISLSPQEAHKRLRAGIKKAIRQHEETPLSPLIWPAPYTLEKRYFYTDIADDIASAAGAERVDSRTVRIRSNSIRDIVYR